LLAAQCVDGQIERLGPCDEPDQVRAYIETAIVAAERLDFTELPTAEELEMKWQYSRAAFQRLQQLAPIWFAERRYKDKFTLKNLQPRKPTPEAIAKGSATAPHQIKLYVDGSCDPEIGCGGWAAVTTGRTGPPLRRSDGGKAAAKVRSGRQFRCCSGGLSDTTNNQAELTAAYKGLSGINSAHQITLHTDSQYVYGRLQRIILEHRKHGPHVGSMFFKPPAVHGELWLKLEEVISRLSHPLRIVKLLGHTGHEVHDRCDALAKEAMYGMQRRRPQRIESPSPVHR
jgi:ribonuclease HI